MTTNLDEEMIRIQPSEATLKRWADSLTTPNDVWYWDDSLADINIAGQTVLPRQEYFEAYPDISYVNAYWHWRMPKSVRQVVVTAPSWIGSLSDGDRQRVVAIQVELDRGQIFPEKHFDRVPEVLEPYRIEGKIVLARAAWKSLDKPDQFTFLRREMLSWDDTNCFPVPSETPAHIGGIANAYGDEHGTNCLSTTAFCITARDDLRHKWMFQPEFLEILAGERYEQVDSDIGEPGDVMTFSDNGVLVHAAWCISPDRYINKNGQSMFNPVRIVNRAMLLADWADQDVAIYRQRKS